jgi:hypothetical protein
MKLSYAREFDGEGCSTGLTFYQNLAMMVFYDLVGDSEPQTYSLSHVSGRKKWIEDAAHNFFRYSLSRVAHRGIDKIGVMPALEDNLAWWVYCVAGINQEIKKDLIYLTAIADELRSLNVLFTDCRSVLKLILTD